MLRPKTGTLPAPPNPHEPTSLSLCAGRSEHFVTLRAGTLGSPGNLTLHIITVVTLQIESSKTTSTEWHARRYCSASR